MNLADLERATAAQHKLTESKRRRDELSRFMVVGVMLAPDFESQKPIELRRGMGGTGWVSAIGFPEDLALVLDNALRDWLAVRIAEAEAELTRLGVELD